MRFVQFIADYGKKDPAFSEVMQRLMMEVPDAIISETSVAPFSTEETGFWMAQFALSPAPKGMIIYTNTAPRKDELSARVKNAGEGLVYAKLNNGVEVVGVNSGYSFAFLKKQIVEFYKATVANEGSQFRSRDFYPRIVGMVARGDYSFKAEALNVADLPDVPAGVILAVDGYGNIKTSWKAGDFTNLKGGSAVRLKIGEVELAGIYADGTFSVKDGEMAFAAGSSGGFDGDVGTAEGEASRFMECFLRGGSAARVFVYPTPGTKVEVII